MTPRVEAIAVIEKITHLPAMIVFNKSTISMPS
jgi:hypothetical protein